jgi:hypothetical protein
MFIEFHLGDWGCSVRWVVVHHYPGDELSILGCRRRIDWEKGGMVEKESRGEEGDIPIHRPRWFTLSKELGPNIVGLRWW